jgi:hypothetical protein
MNVSQQFNQQRGAESLYRTCRRACLAICVVLAPVVLFLGFAFDPTGGVGIPSSARVLAANFQVSASSSTGRLSPCQEEKRPIRTEKNRTNLVGRSIS